MQALDYIAVPFRILQAQNAKSAGKPGACGSLGWEECLERAKGFEPSTPTLARLCSTPELHPHPDSGAPAARGGLIAQSAEKRKRLLQRFSPRP